MKSSYDRLSADCLLWFQDPIFAFFLDSHCPCCLWTEGPARYQGAHFCHVSSDLRHSVSYHLLLHIYQARDWYNQYFTQTAHTFASPDLVRQIMSHPAQTIRLSVFMSLKRLRRAEVRGVSKIFRTDAVKIIKLAIIPIGNHHPRSSSLPHVHTGPTVSSISGTLPGSPFLSVSSTFCILAWIS
jgi:hypothetical protein